MQRTFAPASPASKYANAPFDPTESFHATHVAGIAAGDHGTLRPERTISGVAPNAYLGNYKALTIPTPELRPRRQQRRDRRRDRGGGLRRHERDQPLARRARGRADARHRRHGDRGRRRAGVVPVVAAGNDFDEFGYGSVSSPGNAPDAITVAAVTTRTARSPTSRRPGPPRLARSMKPDVAAPGVAILSSLPASQGTFGLLSGTSMAAPHVAGAAALLKERHPTWTVAQIKSALEQTGDPVRVGERRRGALDREGGGLDRPRPRRRPAALRRADRRSRSAASHRPRPRRAPSTLTDAGGGAGDWAVTSRRPADRQRDRRRRRHRHRARHALGHGDRRRRRRAT